VHWIRNGQRYKVICSQSLDRDFCAELMDNHSQGTDPEPLSVNQDVSIPSSLHERPPRSYPATVHVFVLCAFVLPFAMVPYLAARRHTTKVARTVKGLNDELQQLRNELNAAASHQKELQSELRNLKIPIADASKHLRELREQVSRWETHSAGVEQAMQADLRRLLDEVQHSRYFS